ncbi:MAG: 16S rRNA processing protein RimM [Gemmatimonadetes bacterium]|nr:16S rRNA processing protein RimM [Gemmatimonadota bacterium]
MTGPGPRRLVVGRLRKPHGLKGEFTVFPLTSTPEAVFTAGSKLMRVDLGGEPLGELVVESARPYHREWLVRFRGVADRPTLDSFRGAFLSADAAQLAEPEGDEVYLHELEGFSVRDEAGTALGLVTGLYEVASGLMIEVQGPKREFLLPYKKEFVVGVERGERRLVVRVPDGLLD